MQRSNLDSILITIMLGLFLFSGFKLFLEDQNHFLVGRSDFLASIDSLENTVKKKSGTHLAWNDAKSSQKLFDGDQLYTHENSEVDILFRDKTKINILENSLFKLERKKEEAIIVLKEGIFYIRTRGDNRKIKVKVAGKELSIDSLKAKLQVQGEGANSKIIVLEGSAKIGINDQEILLRPNQFIEVKKSKSQIKMEEIKVQLLTPLHNTTIFNQEKIEFNWKLSKTKTSLFQLSSDPNFKKIILNKDLDTDSFSLESFVKGTYYWRVLENKTSKAFEIRKLTIFEPIRIIGPLYSSLIRMKKPDSKVYFNWQASSTEIFQIEVAEDINFKNIRTSQKVSGQKYIWDKAIPGQYYWRLKKLINEDQIFTKPYPFQIRRESPLAPPSIKKIKKKYKIELKKSSSKKNFSLLDLFINTASADEFEKQTTLEWPLNKEAKSYIIEVYSDIKLKNLLLKKQTTQNKFVWRNPPIGKFYWRLALVDFWEQSSAFSETIKAEVIAPKIKKKVISKVIKTKKPPSPIEIKKIAHKQNYFEKIKGMRRNYLRFIQSPSLVKFNSSKGIINIDSSGSSLAAFEVAARIKRKEKDFIDLSIKRLTGEAFTDLNYESIKAKAAFGRYFHLGQDSPLYYKVGILGASSTYFLRKGIDELEDSSKTSFAFSASVGGENPSFYNLIQHYELQAGVGSILSLNAKYDLHYKFNDKYSFAVGSAAAYESFSTEEEVSVSLLNFNFRFSAFYYF